MLQLLQDVFSKAIAQLQTPQFIAALACFIAVEIGLGVGEANLQWQWLTIYAFLLIGFTALSYGPWAFFRGAISGDTQDAKSSILLAQSAFISWIFAKSIQNASKLGGKYGVTGD